MDFTRPRARLVTRLVQKYGQVGASQLLERFEAGESSARIAPDYDVSAEIIRQWRLVLGNRITTWQPYPDMKKLAAEHLRALPKLG